MKLPYLLLSIATLFTASCATTGSPPNVKSFAGPAATVATSALLSQTKDTDERAAKAEKIIQIADALAALSSDTTTAADISLIVAKYTGGDPKYAVFGVALGALFERYGSNLGTAGQREVINDIAEGVKAGAAMSAS